MPEKPWFPSRTTRQTLLSFGPLTANKPLETQTDCESNDKPGIVPGPPRSLPIEVWNAVLSTLGTIALKKFRLVCQQWNAIGVELLFETFYLNSFEKSWAGLVALSDSAHASKVQRIEWNPLVFYDDCEDGTIWASRYRPMIQGLGMAHGDLLRFHQAFLLVYRVHQSLLRTTSLDFAAAALRRLVNCRSLVISDDFDFANTCDNETKAAIAVQPKILQYAATWGLRLPCSRGYNTFPNYEVIADNSKHIVGLMKQAPSIVVLTLNVWDSFLPFLFWVYWKGSTNAYIPHVTSVHLRIKFPPKRGWPHASDDGYHDSRERHCISWYMTSCPALMDLSYTVALSDPNPFHPGHDQSYHSLCIPSPSASTASDEGSEDNASPLESVVEGCTAMIDKNHFLQPIYLGILRSLTLSDLFISARSLLCLFSVQERWKTPRFSLRLHGIVILSALDPDWFFEGLAQLNVQISYEASSTSYYPPEPWVNPGDPSVSSNDPQWKGNYDLPMSACVYGSGDRWDQVPQWDANRCVREHCYDYAPTQMPPCPSIVSQLSSIRKPKMTRYVDQYPYSKEQAKNVSVEELRATKYYRLRNVDDYTVWEWVSGSSILDPQTHEPWGNTFVIQKLVFDIREGQSCHSGCCFSWCYEAQAEEQRIRLAEGTPDPESEIPPSTLWLIKQAEQRQLQQYEIELQSVDLQDQYLSTQHERRAFDKRHGW